MKPSASKKKKPEQAPKGPPKEPPKEPKDADLKIWGLTGGVASGKSTAARFFEQAGIAVVDADRVARELSEPGGAAHPAILKRFGTADRGQLRHIVFNDPAARQDLEAILHPLIRFESLRQLRALAVAQAKLQGKSVFEVPVLYEAALLVETGRHRGLSGLIVVTAPESLRTQRLIERDGATPEMAASILAAQLSEEKRLAEATIVIENSGSLEDLRQKVDATARRLLSK